MKYSCDTRAPKEWTTETPERAKVYAQERLIVDVTEELWRVMEEKKVTKAALADKLGRSRPYVTQLFNGSRNMTLRTLAHICHELGVTPTLVALDKKTGQ